MEVRDTQVDRTPPQDVQAEQSVLGAMLMSKDAIANVVEVLKAVDFYRPAHELIFEAILDLYGKGEPADAITVAAELTRRGEISRCGGHVYIHDLLASISIAANASYYADIVREKAVLRRLVEASIKISQLGYSGTGDVADIVDLAQQAVYAVAEGKTSEDYKPISALIEPVWNELEAIASNGGRLAGVPTGFSEFDELTNGLHGGQMVIVAARPAIGKALALDTPLPTPSGWTVMGDVQVGDQLLGMDGAPTTVVAATEVMTERPCYRVTFSDGTQIVADAEHQWRASSRAARRAAAERRERFRYPEAARAHVLSLAADPPREPQTFAELVSLVGPELAGATRAATTKVGVASRVSRLAHGPKRSYAWSAPGYAPGPVLATLAAGLTAPMGSASAAQHDPVVTTEQMAAMVRLADGRCNWSVPLTAPLDLPTVDLPLDPYALGVWLGDGHSRGARYTSVDPEIADHLRSRGLVVRPGARCTWSMALTTAEGAPVRGGVVAALRSLEVWGAKSVPMTYLRAARQQRLDVLRGLMDTDGTVSPTGLAQLTVTSERLAMTAYDLVVGLGIRVGMTTRTVRGARPETCTAYTLSFTAGPDVFLLGRKQQAMRDRKPQPLSSHARYVTSVERVDSVPVRCVQVDNGDHMYLASRAMVPTHNSTLALDFARSAAIKHGLTTAIFSLEMSSSEIMNRVLSAEGGLMLHHLRTGRLSDADWEKLASVTGRIESAPLFVDDSPNLTMMEIRAKARRLKQRHNLKFVIIDYLQLMTSGKKTESRQVEVSEISRQIKLLAKELEVPVLALSQLNRGSEQRTDKKPMLSDLRESGSLEQDADMVILLHRDEVYNKDDRPGEADMIVAKHRNGATKTLVTAFQGHYSRFVDMQPL